MVFMVQSEVAGRMSAKPGGKEYGALSVAVQYYSRPEKVFEVPPHCFIPQPEVYSSVVRLDIYKEPPVLLKDKQLFFRTVKAAFGQRRKTLVNALYNSGYFNISKEEIKEMLLNMGVGENQRGETLSIMQFAELSNFIFRKK
jgi:16S rRNA (adenine1518-N6/adenine1519-N6)-dimethyltransferase